ncbi:anti-phage dCTP deaminase [Terasakiella pusilla]|uniref:anti-phage dCTP deaminase n=1 Tax=Terasakiella pusilla TaxID=64973 RepID=UPI003AA8DD87
MGNTAANSPKLFSNSEKDKPEKTKVTLESRETDELVLGLVGPVGSGVTTTANELADTLEQVFGYEIVRIKMSDLIYEASHHIKVKLDDIDDNAERITKYQDAGTKLREKFETEYLAEKCVDFIARDRIDNAGYEKVGDAKVPLPTRKAYIIDSLKHPDEISLFKDVYGELFWTVGIFAPEEIRKERLREKGSDKPTVERIIQVDEEEGPKHGQRVRDTIQEADFFIRNDKSNRDGLQRSIRRYLDLIFNTKLITPNQDETAMYNAAAAAAGSGCLSRQVGAAIYSVDGELLSKGRNDVPKSGGGLYCSEDFESDHRCHKWGENKCHNDTRKDGLYLDIYKVIQDHLAKGKGIEFADIKEALRSTDVKNLIEFSRAVHAEMDAILSVARTNKSGLVGGTLYCTTFPCHSCARHIVAAGLARVVYIEPYPKSLALTLHKDAIATQDKDDEKVLFVQYEGVAPKNMLRMFKQRQNRKKDGKAVTIKPKDAKPVSRSPLDGYARREQIIVSKLHDVETQA